MGRGSGRVRGRKRLFTISERKMTLGLLDEASHAVRFPRQPLFDQGKCRVPLIG